MNDQPNTKTIQQQLNAAVAERGDLDRLIEQKWQEVQDLRKQRVKLEAKVIDLERSLTP